MLPFLVPFFITLIVAVTNTNAQNNVFNVLDYGAKNDGVTMNTIPIQKTIAAIEANNGGILYFPFGWYMTGPFNLTSNCILLLDGAQLIATNNFNAWTLQAPLPSYGQGRDHTSITWERYGPFIGGYNLTNVTITTNSTGIINGNGAKWWEAKINNTLAYTPGHLIEIAYSTGIEIGAPVDSVPQSLIFMDSPFWNVHLYSGSNGWFHDIWIQASTLSPNTDGIDPDSFQNLLIENFHYIGGDDAVAIKSGWDLAGILYNVPSKNITVRNSVFSTRSSCVCIGSEMSGGVEDVFVQNVTCSGTGTGFYVKSSPGRGGYVKNFTMVDTYMESVGVGIEISLSYGDHPDGKPVNNSALPILDQFTVQRVTGKNIRTSGSLLGMINAQITNVFIEDVNFGPNGGPWVCGNVSGTSNNVYPTPCSAIGG